MMFDVKRFALVCAVVHYGLGNLSRNSKPPNVETVLNTARKFSEYLNDNS